MAADGILDTGMPFFLIKKVSNRQEGNFAAVRCFSRTRGCNRYYSAANPR